MSNTGPSPKKNMVLHQPAHSTVRFRTPSMQDSKKIEERIQYALAPSFLLPVARTSKLIASLLC